MKARTCGSPGNHPHADQPNWRPAETYDEYLHNCAEGLEQRSLRREAKLLGVSHTELWRWQLMAELPEDLFEALLAASPRPTTKALANVALALKGNHRSETECCPHCGGVLRVRNRVGAEAARVVNEWIGGRACQ